MKGSVEFSAIDEAVNSVELAVAKNAGFNRFADDYTKNWCESSQFFVQSERIKLTFQEILKIIPASRGRYVP
jgi:hypothetical protein